MTPETLASQRASAGADCFRADDGGGPSYPRISDLLDRIRTTATEPSTSAGAAHDERLPRAFSEQVVADAVAADLAPPSAVAHAMPSSPWGAVSVEAAMVAGAPATPARVVEHSATITGGSRSALADFDDEELDELVGELSLRDVAREALRARLIAAAMQRHPRSAYEIVFILLAFAVTVLITAPPLVDVLLALHGTRP